MLDRIKSYFFKRQARQAIGQMLERDCILLADEVIYSAGLDADYPEVVAEAERLRALMQ